jgi:hypothetical protein
MSWISVADKLPAYEVEVLTTDGRYCNVGQRYATGKRGERWRLANENDDDGEATQLTVTHWMELPALPTNEPKGRTLGIELAKASKDEPE